MYGPQDSSRGGPNGNLGCRKGPRPPEARGQVTGSRADHDGAAAVTGIGAAPRVLLSTKRWDSAFFFLSQGLEALAG